MEGISLPEASIVIAIAIDWGPGTWLILGNGAAAASYRRSLNFIVHIKASICPRSRGTIHNTIVQLARFQGRSLCILSETLVALSFLLQTGTARRVGRLRMRDAVT